MNNQTNRLNLITRLRYNLFRLGIIGVIVLAFIGIWVWVSTFFNNSAGLIDTTDAPPLTNTTAEFFGVENTVLALPDTTIFSDPVGVPDTLETYTVLSGPEELFSPQNIPAVTAVFGFTKTAQTYPTANGFLYFEQGQRLAIDSSLGVVEFSLDTTNLAPQQRVSDTSQLISRAQNLVTSTGFNSPLILWDNATITAFEQVSGVLQETTTNNVLFYEISVPFAIQNLPLFFPQKLYVRITPDGILVGARLWYPNLQPGDSVVLIDFVSAVNRARRGNGVLVNGSLEDTSFNSTRLAFVVPANLESINEPTLRPMYVFENENTTLYVDAVLVDN